MTESTIVDTPRISASAYSNTAPLIWSFLYGSMRGRVEIILDNAPARSAELLNQNRVDAALVPVIAYHQLADVQLIPDVCVAAKEKVRSVVLFTRGKELQDVHSVALDSSSKTSVVLTKIIFREFLGFEPEWHEAVPDLNSMLDRYDAALLIGDPALRNAECGTRNVESLVDTSNSALRIPHSALEDSALRPFDLAALWKNYTGLGFVFAMWMTSRDRLALDFAAARDEGLTHLDEIGANYSSEIGLSRDEMVRYLSENISYSVDDSTRAGMELYFELADKCGLIKRVRPLRYLEQPGLK